MLDVLSFFYNLWYVQYAILPPNTIRYCPFFSLRIIHFPVSPLLPSTIIITLFPQIRARGDYFFFLNKKGETFRGKVIICGR